MTAMGERRERYYVEGNFGSRSASEKALLAPDDAAALVAALKITPQDTVALLRAAWEAAGFLDRWHPQTERFIEATLPLDAALNRVTRLLEGATGD